ncbi:hypothetical protein BV25DRAFT_1922085 [Artomyces pyxidatus]|uniref:Uncharacterized protein n=1 Tax=Artomyces pyxidatus TaxID=48021 RepID=A0ACB8SFH9_9AGAM|nr:hypothetical protein BV25DRAFT_1922085 [Artomyces pyxidatus]
MPPSRASPAERRLSPPASTNSITQPTVPLHIPVTQDNFEALKQQIADMHDQLAQVSAATITGARSQIPRPPRGTAGDGFNLQHEMGLDGDRAKYKAIRNIRRCIVAGRLDTSLKWRDQDKQKLGRLFSRLAVTILTCRASHDWATEEFVKSMLKNKRNYAARTGINQKAAELSAAGDDI